MLSNDDNEWMLLLCAIWLILIIFYYSKAGPPPPQSAPGSGGGYMSQPSDMENDTIFISGMPLDVTEDQLSSHFGSIGIIKVCR